MSPLIRIRLVFVVLALGMQCGCQMSTAHNSNGVKQFRSGQYQAALDSFQRAVAANPDDPDAYYNLAATLHDWGRRARNASLLEQSESLYNRCLDLSPDHVDCHRALAVLLVDSSRKDSAFTLLERWAQRSPTLGDPQIELARLHEEFGDEGSAKQYLTQALDIQSGNPRAWAALARIREGEGRFAQALSNYQQAYNINRNHPGVTQRIASLQQRIASTNSPGLGNSSRGRLAAFPGRNGPPAYESTGLSRQADLRAGRTDLTPRVTRTQSDWSAVQ